MTGLKLQYPVASPVLIVQRFGVNQTGVPDFYTRYGLPAHEGLDFGGALNEPIFAAADGTILAITPDNGLHPYGNHIRITHIVNQQVFTTVYAHLAGFVSSHVVGQRVSAGTLIGYMGTTGNSHGVHLHLTLKKSGATARKEKQFALGQWVVYPNDIVDPTSYLK